MFIYLINIIFMFEISPKDELLCKYLNLLNLSMNNSVRDIYYESLGRNIFTTLLIENKIRL
jgi:hypothetical protein